MLPPLAPPHTYAQWSECLDRLLAANDDERVLCALRSGTGEFGSGTAEHLARRLDHTFAGRLTRCHDQFARSQLQSRDLATLGRALLDFRCQLAFLYQVASVPAFTARIRDHLAEMLDTSARAAQDSLEESAKADRSGLTLQCVRRHSLLSFREVADAASPERPLIESPFPSPRRPRTLL